MMPRDSRNLWVKFWTYRNLNQILDRKSRFCCPPDNAAVKNSNLEHSSRKNVRLLPFATMWSLGFDRLRLWNEFYFIFMILFLSGMAKKLQQVTKSLSIWISFSVCNGLAPRMDYPSQIIRLSEPWLRWRIIIIGISKTIIAAGNLLLRLITVAQSADSHSPGIQSRDISGILFLYWSGMIQWYRPESGHAVRPPWRAKTDEYTMPLIWTMIQKLNVNIKIKVKPFAYICLIIK